MKKNRIVKSVLVICGGLCMTLQVQAEEVSFVGPRASGMAGANAASTRDSSAQYLNPAAFGFFGRSEWEKDAVDNGNLSGQGFSYETLGIGIGYTMTEDMGRYLDILAGIDFDSFGAGTLSAAEKNVDSFLTFAAVLGSLDPGDSLYADASVGTSIQIGHFGVGIRMFGEATAWTLADRDKLSLDSFPNVAALVTELQNAASTAGFTWDGNYSLTDEQRATLATALGGISDSDDAIKYLDSRLGALAASGRIDGSELAKAVELFKNFDPAAIGGGVIGSNQTAVVGRGFTVVEVPLSYGWAMNKNLSFGVTAKAMYGSVLGTQLWVFNEDNDKVYENLSDSVKSTMNFGLDLGALYRIPNFQFALVGHNLNRPTFDGFSNTITVNGNPQTISVPDVAIDPQVTFGAAFIPSERFTLEADIDLLEVGTLLDAYTIQRFSVGTEVDLWLLALRLGAYKNLAEEWQDWVATAGVGLDIFGLRVDVGGAYSLGDNAEYDGVEIPSEARLFASIGLDF